MALNKRLLKKVRNRIAKIPESYDQGVFYVGDSDAAPWGAVACLAGEMVICAAPTIKQGIAKLISGNWTVGKIKDVYGLPPDHMMFGVNADGWPQPFKGDFAQCKTQASRAKVAVAYLDECLKRGVVTW